MTKQVEAVAQAVPGIKILIDTNIYLDFYRGNKDSTQLLSELSKHFDKIILTDQIVQEFERNREVVIKDLKKRFEAESTLENISSSYLKDLPEFTALLASQKDYLNKRQAVISSIDKILDSPEQDPVYSFFSAMVSYAIKNDSLLSTTDEILQKAQRRKLIGNPPTSSGISIGDEINWEIVRENITENIILVGRDNTYTKNYSFLKRDFHVRHGKQIIKLTNSITDALKEVGVVTTAELVAIEQKMLGKLKHFNEFWKHSPKEE